MVRGPSSNFDAVGRQVGDAALCGMESRGLLVLCQCAHVEDRDFDSFFGYGRDNLAMN